MSTYGTVGPNDYLWSCSICGALVVNRHQHDGWHVRAADTTSTFDWAGAAWNGT